MTPLTYFLFKRPRLLAFAVTRKGEPMQKRIALLVGLIFTFTVFAAGQAAKPSPPASATCDLGGNTIKTDYSSPRMKGRKIFGGLVPYGQVWRTGANEATTFVTSTDVVVGGKAVPAGSYTIFTIPNADKWTLIINKKTGEWGIPYKYEADELARVDMKVSKLSHPVEEFTIAYKKLGNGCVLMIDWENTRAAVEIGPKQ
jgi:Protein of unknown function (DUF2911)